MSKYKTLAFAAAGAVAVAALATGCTQATTTSKGSAPVVKAAPADEATTTPDDDSSDPASATKATNHVGDTVLVADWQVKVTKVVLNDDRALHAANQFNDKPKRGTHYVLVDYTAKYTGSERTADTEFDLDWNLTQRDAKVLDDTFEDTGHNYTTKARKGGTVRGEVLFEAASPTLVSVSDILGNDYADFSV